MLKNPKELNYLSPLAIPKGKSGKYSIKHLTHPAREPITVVSVRTAIFTGQKPLRVSYDLPITYHALDDKDGMWMTDTPPEQVTPHEYLKQCSGSCLVGGLGLGYFPKKLQEKEDVKKVVVVEISKDVIKLVWKHLKLDKRFTIIQADIGNFLKTTNLKFDSVYIDVWRADSERVFIDKVLPLKVLAKRICHNQDKIFSWQEEVMMGQLRTGLHSEVLIKFKEITTMSDEEFSRIFRSKYLKTRRHFWRFIREYKVDITAAQSIIKPYLQWVSEGMEGEFKV